MQLDGIMGFIYRICDWIMKLAYINVLWILFTIMGLGIFGVMPATVSLFAVIRKWLMGQTDISIFRTYWENYRESFVKINVIGIVLAAIGYGLHLDSVFTRKIGGTLSIVLLTFLLILTVVYLLIVLYIFPVFVHFNLSIVQYLKYTLIFAISNLIGTLAMIVGGIAVYLIDMTFPVIIPFFSINLLSFMLMWVANRSFKKIEKQIIDSRVPKIS